MTNKKTSDYGNLKPMLSKYIILRYATPETPLIYHKKKHQLIKATNYKVLDILRLCNCKRNIKIISEIVKIEPYGIYKLLLKLEHMGCLSFESDP